MQVRTSNGREMIQVSTRREATRAMRDMAKRHAGVTVLVVERGEVIAGGRNFEGRFLGLDFLRGGLI